MKAEAIELVTEIQMTPRHRSAIVSLLHQSFPDYPDHQIFYPQPPHFRLLAWREDSLVGHLAAILRSVMTGGKSITILGIADLCTDPAYTGQRIASRLLNRIEELALRQGIPFLMAMAANPEFYLHHKFLPIEVRCTWLAFMNGRSLGLFQRTPPSGLVVKPVGDMAWPPGDIDLLGPLF